MKNVLIPTDFSENSWNAIEYAINYFSESNCNFYILHVIRVSNLVNTEMPYVATMEVVDETLTLPSKNQLKSTIARIEELPKNKKHNFFTLTDYNFFIDSIRNQIEEKKIDYIVMGTKGASGLKKLIVGSNTGDVITKVKCTTLVVPENAKFVKPSEIAFPTDFSLFYHMTTLEPVTHILDHFDASLRVLHISKKEISLTSDQQRNKEHLEDYFNNYDYSFHFLTNKHIEGAIQYNVLLKAEILI